MRQTSRERWNYQSYPLAKDVRIAAGGDCALPDSLIPGNMHANIFREAGDTRMA